MLLSNEFAPDPRVYNEAKVLVDNGYDVTILAWDRELRSPKVENIDGIKVERIPILSVYSTGIRQIWRMLVFWLIAFWRAVKKDFDVIHCHDFDTLPLGFAIATLKGRKIIFDAHESYSDTPGIASLKVLSRIIDNCERHIVRKVDFLITVGERLRQKYVRQGVKYSKVIGNWKRLQDYYIPALDRTFAKRRLDINDNQLVISYITWLNPERMIIPLIEAASISDNVFVILGGTGILENEIKNRIKECNNIRYIGFVHPRDIPLYTVIADVIYYGFDQSIPLAQYSAPNKLFEALAAGKAIISGDFGEIAKIVREEQCGLVIENINTDKLVKAFNLLNDKAILQRFQSNALSAAQKKYNWSLASKELLMVYKLIEN